MRLPDVLLSDEAEIVVKRTSSLQKLLKVTFADLYRAYSFREHDPDYPVREENGNDSVLPHF